MKFILSILGMAILSGCATEVISSSERTVMIRGTLRDAAEAQKLADAECKKYGRAARYYEARPGRMMIYDCVQ